MPLPSQENLNKWTSIATILSLVAVPIVIGVYGSKIQSSIANEGIKKDYVQMAIKILSEEPHNNENEDLRKWSIDIVEANSPIKFSSALKAKLETRSWLMPNLINIKHFPPKELMESPIPLLRPIKKNSEENFKRSIENANKLQELQKWLTEQKKEYEATDKFFSDLNKRDKSSKISAEKESSGSLKE